MIIAQLKLSLIVNALIGVKSSRRFPVQLLSTKADDIVETSSELDSILVILGGFRWIHNEQYLNMKISERLLLLHTIEHMLSGHAYDRTLRSHFLTAASLTAVILDVSSLMDEIDVRRLI